VPFTHTIFSKEGMMAARKPAALRVVSESEAAAPKKSLTVKQAADSGDRRSLLVSLRARIAAETDNPNTPARDLAALSRRLLEIAKDIEAIDAQDKGDEVGDASATPDEEWVAT